jgi:tetratricopeptide (TPR) repeat protein
MDRDMADAGAAAATPQDIIAAATARADAGELQAGLALLLDAKNRWAAVPPAYDGAIGRLALRAGRTAEAIEYLEAAKARFKAVPAWVHRLLGSALLTAGRTAEAGRELSLALQAGVQIASRSELVAAEDYCLSTGRKSPIDYRCEPNFAFTDIPRGVQYVAIPKNACTLLKATFIMNSDFRDSYLASGQSIHEFYAACVQKIPRDAAIARNPARIVVLRDPFNRILSAYLNKFVRPAMFDPGMAAIVSRTVKHAQRIANVDPDPDRSITFAEFVGYLTVVPDIECDVHWLPQHRICGANMSIYTHVGRFERLDATLDYLATQHNIIPETSIDAHIRHSETHITRYDPACPLSAPWKALPADLRDYSTGYPPAEAFYTDELREAVLRRYAIDAALHARA